MFNRYSLTAAAKEVVQRYLVDVPEGYRPHYNAAPTHLLSVITQDSPKGLSFFYWGAPPSWANKKPLGEKIINTRTESIFEKLVLKKRLHEKRCLIPADGFYEWKRLGKRTSVPYRFILKDKSIFSLAGLWEEYDDEHGETHHTFTVITTAANASVLPFNERMPVILLRDQEKVWLTADNERELLAVLEIYSGALQNYSVSPLVNSPDCDDKSVILPAPAADQFGNLTLFD